MNIDDYKAKFKPVVKAGNLSMGGIMAGCNEPNFLAKFRSADPSKLWLVERDSEKGSVSVIFSKDGELTRNSIGFIVTELSPDNEEQKLVISGFNEPSSDELYTKYSMDIKKPLFSVKQFIEAVGLDQDKPLSNYMEFASNNLKKIMNQVENAYTDERKRVWSVILAENEGLVAVKGLVDQGVKYYIFGSTLNEEILYDGLVLSASVFDLGERPWKM